MIKLYKKIVAAVDGSEPSFRALSHALIIAEKFNAELAILTAFQKLTIPIIPPDEDNEDDEFTLNMDLYNEYWDHIKNIHKKTLQDAEIYAKKNAPLVNVHGVLIEGVASTVIKDYSAKIDADLIVLGSSGIGGLKGWLLGSTSKNVVDTCKRPVLVIK